VLVFLVADVLNHLLALILAGLGGAVARLEGGAGEERIGRADELVEIANRGAATSRFIVRASEMNALNDLMDLHDAQMDVITIKDMEGALALAKSEVKAGRATRLIAKGLSQ
jgi:hypothetical protein